MAVTWVAGSTEVANSGELTISANAPSGIEDDDTLLAAVMARSAITTPTGWTKLAETPEFSRGSLVFQRVAVFSKDTVTAGNSGQSFTWAQAGSGDSEIDRMAVVYAVMRDVEAIEQTATETITETSDADAITPDTLTADANGQMLVAFASTIYSLVDDVTPTPPASFTIFSGATLAQYRLAGARRAVDNGQSNSGAFDFNLGSGFGANGLGAVILRLSSTSIPPVEALVAVPTMLAAPSIRARQSHPARVAVPSPLQAPSLLGVSYFADSLGDALSTYVMDLTTPSGDVRVPISSWQATIRAAEDSYVQCVVPAPAAYIDDLEVATEFAISRRVVQATGDAIEYEMASAPLQTLATAEGGFSYSATLSGYEPASTGAAPTTPRALSDIRVVYITGASVRVRCAIDWLLRPGWTASADGREFVVEYVSYWINESDAYMEAGGT